MEIIITAKNICVSRKKKVLGKRKVSSDDRTESIESGRERRRMMGVD